MSELDPHSFRWVSTNDRARGLPFSGERLASAGQNGTFVSLIYVSSDAIRMLTLEQVDSRFKVALETQSINPDSPRARMDAPVLPVYGSGPAFHLSTEFPDSQSVDSFNEVFGHTFTH